MAQTGFTPIQLYYSSTTTNVPLAANLANGELAINITDGKLFYKDNAAAVQVIGWKTTPTSAGGTGLTSYTAGDTVYYASGTTLTKLSIGTAYQAFQVNAGATAPSWQPSATSVLTAQGDLLYASGANTLARLAKDANATRYLSNTGTTNNPAWAQVDISNGVTGTLAATSGGTGQSTVTTGDLLYGSATNTWSKLADVATGNALISGGVGVAPSYGKIGLTTHVSGTLPTANGGTNLTSFTSGGVVYASSTSALTTGSSLVFNGTNLLVGNATSYAGKFQSWGAVTANAGTPNLAAIDTTLVASGVGGELAFIGQYQSGDYAYFGSIRGIKENGTSGDTACALTFSVRPTATAPTERMRISSDGIVTMSAYGAGAATFSAAGVISSVSDETWKIKDGVPANPDEMVQKLEPGYWFYNEEKAPVFGQDRQLGFYAQNVHSAIGEEAAPTPETYIETDEDGNALTKTKPWGYYDRSVLAVTVMSLKNALNTISSMQKTIGEMQTALKAAGVSGF